MPSQVLSSVENNFTKGLITEATGLNFPENAATDCDNCEFTLIGDVNRRLGITFEPNTIVNGVSLSPSAQSQYIWNNPGGDGEAKILVRQEGTLLYFYLISAVTTTSSISANKLAGVVDMSIFGSGPSIIDSSVECTYADGNGYLFVYNSSTNPFYVTYDNGVIGAKGIPVYIRDFAGVNDSLATSTRPASLSIEHQYNLQNQGWISGNPWQASSSTSYPIGATGGSSWTVASGITGIVAGQKVSIAYLGSGTAFGFPPTGTVVATGTVTSYAGSTLAINITFAIGGYTGTSNGPWSIVPISVGFIDTFFSAANAYPSNADVWWYFKDNTGAYSPSTTLANVSYSSGLAPRGHYIYNAFYLDRGVTSGLGGITPVFTWARPSTGTWFQGRVWYTGVNANFAATGDANSYTWTENIYFSQIVQTVDDFGSCFQVNDPTSETLNGLLPTDGGVIKVVGTGRIHKLFPIANGLLVFANNGVWFITGSQGIGFTANDYTVTKISAVKVLSPYSFIDVNGLPFFWNEEGIYQVLATQNGNLTVEPITVGTILTFYNDIPIGSKYYARGDYDPVNYVIQWTYRSTPESGIADRYNLDKILNYNTYNKAFFPYTISGGTLEQFVNGCKYVSYPNVTESTPEPGFVYPCSYIGGGFRQTAFAKEFDESFLDWGTSDYDSYFVTGYKVHGQGQKRFQVPYIYVFSRGPELTAYKIQSIWDYAVTSNSNRWSSNQIAYNNNPNFGMLFKRHRLRGSGITLQIKVSSVSGKPFDIMGWSVYENLNQGV